MGQEHSFGKDFSEEEKINIKACTCGSVHLAFFGRTSFHLSHKEFLDFAQGVAQVSSELKLSHQSMPFARDAGGGVSH
ncbi:MAG: hypothetical protein ACE5F7_02675 [Nitrospiria bacterium]